MGQGELVHASIFPHPPIMVPEVGSAAEDLEKTRPTRVATQRLAAEIAARQPQTILIITPHGPMHPRAMGLLGRPRLPGDLAYFRAPQVAFVADNDLALVAGIQAEAAAADIPVQTLDEFQPMRLDHGVVVPWYFLREAGAANVLLPMTYSYLANEHHLAFGQAIARAIAASGRRVAVVASGDLSHRLSPAAPAGYNPRGQEFDDIVVAAVGRGDWQAIADIDPELMEAAGECGYRSMLILAGVLGGRPVTPSVYSYEAPYGVGYLVAAAPPGPAAPPLALRGPADLARLAVEAWASAGQRLQPPASLPPSWQRQAGVFVTIRDGEELRGCIGTFRPTLANICAEVMHNAVLAASQDPRFSAVSNDELPRLSYHVNLLDPLEPIPGPEALDPTRYGVVVRAGSRQGLLLPNIPQIASVAEQLQHARAKAGIHPAEPVELFRFTTREYEEGQDLE